MSDNKKTQRQRVEKVDNTKAPVEITDKYKVKVFNNTSGNVYLTDILGHIKVVYAKGFLVLNYEDIEYIMQIAPSKFELGYLFIGDKYVRERIGLNVDNFIQLRHVEEIIRNKSTEELERIFVDLPDHMKREIGEAAYKMRDDLPLRRVKFLEKETGITLIDVLEETPEVKE